MTQRDPLKRFVLLRSSLENEKARLERRLREIDGVLGEKNPAPLAAARAPARKRQPIKNPMPLRQAIVKATSARPLTKKEILAAVRKLGYRFAAKDPMNSINVLLYTRGLFKRQDGRFSPAGAKAGAGASQAAKPHAKLKGAAAPGAKG